MKTIINYQWNTSPTAYITVDYDCKREGTQMLYYFKWKVWLGYSTSYYYNALNLNFAFGDCNFTASVKGYNANEKGWTYTGESGWKSTTDTTSTSIPVTIKLIDASAMSPKMTKTASLTVLPCPSQIGTVNNFDVDDGVVVPFTSYHPNAKETLSINCNGTTVKSEFAYSGEKIIFTDAEKNAIYEVMKSVNAMTFNFVLYTYNENNEQQGKTWTSATGIISNDMPTFNDGIVGVYDIDDKITNVTNNDVFVQHLSNVWVNIPPITMKKGAELVKYEIKVGNQTVITTVGGHNRFGNINQSGGFVLSVTATDTRGHQITISTDIVVLEYKEPTLATTLYRKNNYEEETNLKVETTFASVGELNGIIVTYEHAKTGEAYGTPIQIESGVNNTVACDENYAYNFRITVTDNFGISISQEYLLAKGKFPLFIDTKMNAVGINAFPLDESEALRVANGKAVFEDGIALKSSTEGSNKYFLLSVNDSGQLSITEIQGEN